MLSECKEETSAQIRYRVISVRTLDRDNWGR